MSILVSTARLHAREMRMDDCDQLFNLDSNPDVQKYTGQEPVKNKEQVIQTLKNRVFADYENHGYGRWSIFRKEDDAFIGWAGLKYLPEFKETDLGYRFLPEFWGKGYATEISEAIVEYGFNKLGLKRIIAVAMPENKASIRVIQKLGMKFYKQAPYEPGQPDDFWYELIQK